MLLILALATSSAVLRGGVENDKMYNDGKAGSSGVNPSFLTTFFIRIENYKYPLLSVSDIKVGQVNTALGK